MEFYRQCVLLSIFISTIVNVNSWQCKSLECIIYPQTLKLWSNHIEVSSKSFKVKAGSSFSITCDGSCVGSRADPHLRWYGPDKHWIAYEGRENRIHIEKSFSSRFQKLHLRRVTERDEGLYICRGWLGKKLGWDLKSIRIVVDDDPITFSKATTKSAETTLKSVVSTTTPREIIETTATESARETTRTTKTERPTIEIVTSPEQTKSTEANVIYITRNTTEEECLPPKFKCGSGECFDSSYVCDAYPDCIDASDEKICASSKVCTEGMQACDDGGGCVLRSQICDGVAQCNDKSDEAPDVCNYLHL